MRDTLLVIVAALVVIGIGAGFYYGKIPLPGRSASFATLGVPVAVTPLASGDQSSVTEPANYVITSEDQLRELWQMLGTSNEPPTVDFSQNAVLAVFAGDEPTAGYSISVSKVEDSSSRVVTITLNKPGGSCVLTQEITNPYQIVEVPSTTLPLTHQEVDTTTSCLQ